MGIKNYLKNLILGGLLLSVSFLSAQTQDEYITGDVFQAWEGGREYFAKWTNGPTTDPSVFPIGIWYQDPKNAGSYRNMGIDFFMYANSGLNLYPLTTNGMTIIPTTDAMTYAGPYALYGSTVTTWINPNDELDMGSVPMTPSVVINDYNSTVAKDPTRPIMINVGPCVSLDNCAGRGSRSTHPEDYYEYFKGADFLSFDVYPMNTYINDPTLSPIFANAVAGKLNIIGIGVDRMRMYSNYKKPIVAILECTNIFSDTRCQLTPAHIKPEAWIAIIHGVRSIVYFCHTMEPLVETAVLNNATMVAAIKTNNALIAENASILNSQTVDNATTVFSSNMSITVKQMTKRNNGYTYIYAVAEQSGNTNATFTLRGFTGTSTVEVVGENRTLTSNNGVFTDAFSNYAVHIYKVSTPGKIQSAVVEVKADSKDFIIHQSAESGDINYDCIEPIQKLEVFTINGSKILNKVSASEQGTIQLNNSHKNEVLIVRAMTKNNTYVRKFMLN
ncbi:MAG: hypothetical protein Q7U47_01925 [Paludibacter sp.]|nr:hypothetical protein [Paludibacter sp.]